MQHRLPHQQHYWRRSHFCRTPRLQTSNSKVGHSDKFTHRQKTRRDARGSRTGRETHLCGTAGTDLRSPLAAPLPGCSSALTEFGGRSREAAVQRRFGAAPGIRCRPGGSAPQRPPRCVPPAPRSPLPGGSKLRGALGAALQRGGGSGAATAERRRLRGAARSSRSPAATRRAGCAPLPSLPPPPSLPLPPDDFQFTCRQPGSAALSGTAVAASAPSPPRGGTRTGAARPAGKFGAAPGLRAAPSVGTPRVPDPSPSSRPRGGCLRLPVGIAPVLSISSPVRGYKYLSGILIAASAERLVRVTQSSTNGPTRAGRPGTQGGARLLQSWELRAALSGRQPCPGTPSLPPRAVWQPGVCWLGWFASGYIRRPERGCFLPWDCHVFSDKPGFVL